MKERMVSLDKLKFGKIMLHPRPKPKQNHKLIEMNRASMEQYIEKELG